VKSPAIRKVKLRSLAKASVNFLIVMDDVKSIYKARVLMLVLALFKYLVGL